MGAERKKQEVILRGTPISPGIAIGTALFLHRYKGVVAEVEISPAQIEAEVSRYRQALEKTRQEIERVKQELEEEQAWDGAAILEAHLELTSDPVLACGIEEQVRIVKKNVEAILKQTVDLYRKRFSKVQDHFFQERFKDLQDVTRRILRHLQKNTPHRIALFPERSILFSNELAPSDAAAASSRGVIGFVTKRGGPTCHAAIVAKAQKLPYVTNIELHSFAQLSSTSVIVNGYDGCVILNPTPTTLARYYTLQSNFKKPPSTCPIAKELPTTRDKEPVFLFANLDAHDDLNQLKKEATAGIGLFRSESLLAKEPSFAEEGAQYTFYQKLLEKFGERPVVIRTFDIGGDKQLTGVHDRQENNPFLGCRATRFLLRERSLLLTQLRALLKASPSGNLHILLPMISCLSELLEIKALLKELSQSIHSARYKLGCMIEVPSAALTVDLLLPHVDFLSIGTNDLVQYTLAVDRGNAAMSYLYQPTHPSVLRLIHRIVTEASRFNLPVILCGEMACDPSLIELLLGLGLRRFSLAPVYLPTIRDIVTQVTLPEAQALAQSALAALTSQEVIRLLEKRASQLAVAY